MRIIRLVTTGKAAFALNVFATLMAGFLVTTLQHVLEARPVSSGMGGAFFNKLLSKAMNYKDVDSRTTGLINTLLSGPVQTRWMEWSN